MTDYLKVQIKDKVPHEKNEYSLVYGVDKFGLCGPFFVNIDFIKGSHRRRIHMGAIHQERRTLMELCADSSVCQ